MIEFTKAYKTTDGQTHATLEDAKSHELTLLFCDTRVPTDTEAHFILTVQENADRIIDILSTTATSKPRARKVNGGKKTRAAKPAIPTPPSE